MALKKMIYACMLAAKICTTLYGYTTAEALALLPEAPYGFCFVENKIPVDLCNDLKLLNLQKTRTYNQFGNFESLENNIYDFLCTITNDDASLISRVAAYIAQIAGEVMTASGRETAWISLRASLPTDTYDIPRWHMDGYYFSPADETEILYKYVITLVGPTTLFYPISHTERPTMWRKTMYRDYMVEFCKREYIQQPCQGEGAFFIGGRVHSAALHSEPPINEPRLFLSIVPCSNEQMHELKTKVRY